MLDLGRRPFANESVIDLFGDLDKRQSTAVSSPQDISACTGNELPGLYNYFYACETVPCYPLQFCHLKQWYV